MNFNKTNLTEKLADFLGVEVSDIKDDDDLKEDLHMQPGDISDFIHGLEKFGFDISKIEINKIETLDDLAEFFDLE